MPQHRLRGDHATWNILCTDIVTGTSLDLTMSSSSSLQSTESDDCSSEGAHEEVMMPVRTSVLRHMAQMNNVQREFARQASLRSLESNSLSGHSMTSKFRLLVNDSQSGKTFDETYDVGELLGEGGFAEVFRCYHKKTGNSYAVKKINDEDYNLDGTNSLSAEIKHMKIVRDCSWIIQLFDVFRDGIDTFLVLEEVSGGDLLDKIYEVEKFSIANAKKITHQLLEALRFCHKREVAHRDVKPENILVVDPDISTKIKLCDFGCSKNIAQAPFRTMIGSPLYCAPEVFEHGDAGGYDEICDMWSTGVVLFLILVGYCPFDDGPVAEIARNVTAGDWKFDEEDWLEIPDPPKALVQSLLLVNPKERASADDALNSSWMRRPELDRPNSFRQSRVSSLQASISQLHKSSPDFNFDEFSLEKINHGPMVWQTAGYTPPVPREARVSQKRDAVPVTVPDSVDAENLDTSERSEFSELGASKTFGDSWSALSPAKSPKKRVGAAWKSTPPAKEVEDETDNTL